MTPKKVNRKSTKAVAIVQMMHTITYARKAVKVINAQTVRRRLPPRLR